VGQKSRDTRVRSTLTFQNDLERVLDPGWDLCRLAYFAVRIAVQPHSRYTTATSGRFSSSVMSSSDKTSAIRSRARTRPHWRCEAEISVEILGPQIGTDVLGRPIRQNQIFDPATERIVNGQVVRDPFPNNVIPLNRLSPVSLKIQSLLPLPLRAGNVSNLDTNWVSPSHPRTLATSGEYTRLPRFFKSAESTRPL
jgi:hypothetical protein